MGFHGEPLEVKATVAIIHDNLLYLGNENNAHFGATASAQGGNRYDFDTDWINPWSATKSTTATDNPPHLASTPRYSMSLAGSAWAGTKAYLTCNKTVLGVSGTYLPEGLYKAGFHGRGGGWAPNTNAWLYVTFGNETVRKSYEAGEGYLRHEVTFYLPAGVTEFELGMYLDVGIGGSWGNMDNFFVSYLG